MEKPISRAVMRGKSLDADCKRTKISRYEFGQNDNRCFCYGLIDLRTDCLIDKCIQCSAYACNATPLEDALHYRTFYGATEVYSIVECVRNKSDLYPEFKSE